jgi:hypothetical protein
MKASKLQSKLTKGRIVAIPIGSVHWAVGLIVDVDDETVNIAIFDFFISAIDQIE